MKRVFFILVICFFSFTLSAQMISEGWWYQTASTAGEGDNIAMEVTEMTPHIISLESNNGWVGYAWYVEEKNLYTGFFELLKEKDQANNKKDWSGEVFNFTLTYDGLTLTMKAKSKEHSFLATYWKK